MIAAIYARKSTEQAGVADEQKSVARQIDHARDYATRKGWTAGDQRVYVDDGISGAEFANRPGFLRLMNAAETRGRRSRCWSCPRSRGSDARPSRPRMH
jgi:DNA invertase Pin-like site-specific DNA recombinase